MNNDQVLSPENNSLLRLATDIVAAFVSNNSVAAKELPALIKQVHETLISLGENGDERKDNLRPAVPIKRSVTPEYIVCLEDGKKLKMLKRYLRSHFNMTPEEYRLKWGLPPDYPMVAPNYAAQRSKFAKQIGLGRSGERNRKRTS